MKARQNIGVAWWGVEPGVFIKRQGGSRIVPQGCKVSLGLVLAAEHDTVAAERLVPSAAWVVPLNSLVSESLGGLLGIVQEKQRPLRKRCCMRLRGKVQCSFKCSVVSAQQQRSVSPFGAGPRKHRAAAGRYTPL